MAFDNVVPIDAEAARLLARRHSRLRWFVLALTALWISVLVPVLLLTPLPPLVPFAILAVLVVLAEHRFVLFGDETSMSASIVVIVASVFVFADSAPLAGPMLVASLGGLYLPHVLRGELTLTAANTSIFGLTAAASAAFTSGFPVKLELSAALGLVAAIVCSATYWYVNSVLTGCASALRHQTNLLDSVKAQVTSEWAVLLLATGAALLAQLTDPGHTVLLLIATATPPIAFESQINKLRREGGTSIHPPLKLTAIIGITVSLAIHLGGPGAFALLSIGAFIAVRLGESEGRRLQSVLIAYLLTGTLALSIEHLQSPVAVLMPVCFVAAFASIAVGETVRLSSSGGQRIDRWTTLGTLIPGRLEATALAAFLCAALALSHVALPVAQHIAGLTALAITLQFAPIHPARDSRARAQPSISARRSSAPASR